MNVITIGDNAWLIEWEYPLYWDYSIGMPPLYDSNNQLVLQTAYFFQVVVFAGRNFNPISPRTFDVDEMLAGNAGNADITSALADDDLVRAVDNPYEGFDPQSAEAPAPVDLDPTQLARRSRTSVQLREDVAAFNDEALTYAFMVRRSNRPPLWPDRFTSRSNARNIYAVAAARVFNDHSHDLWTQMWHAQLVSANDFDRWADELEQASIPGGVADYINVSEAEDFGEYIDSLRDLAPWVMMH